MSDTTTFTPATEPVILSRVEIVQATFEHVGPPGDAFLPAGLVPTIPTLVTLLALRAPESPAGPFTCAQVRVSCRSGIRARALVVASAVEAEPEAATWLANGWGIGGAGSVHVDRRYDQVRVSAPWFDVALPRPRPIGVHDVQYVVGLHPVSTDDGDRLAQVELHVELDRVERARPVLERFVAPVDVPGLDPRFVVAATSGVGTLELPAVRYLLPHEPRPV